jgi:hypothetical protein
MMSDDPNTTRITEVGAVFVPVADQDRALEFYLDKLGFEKRADFIYGDDIRWIEVAPPEATNTIALVPPGEGESSGGDETYCAFATKDIEADHAGGPRVLADAGRGRGSLRRGVVANSWAGGAWSALCLSPPSPMTDGAAQYVPPSRSLRELRRAVKDCRGCDLWHDATQAVFLA